MCVNPYVRTIANRLLSGIAREILERGGGGYRGRRRACHRVNSTAAAATTITIVTVSKPGTAPTVGGAPPRIRASTDVDALDEVNIPPDAVAVIRNVVSVPTVAVRVVKNVPFRGIVPLVAASVPPTPVGSRTKVTLTPTMMFALASVAVTRMSVLCPGSKIAFDLSTFTKRRWGTTRTVIAVVPLAAS